jgi:hypothetical protein
MVTFNGGHPRAGNGTGMFPAFSDPVGAVSVRTDLAAFDLAGSRRSGPR